MPVTNLKALVTIAAPDVADVLLIEDGASGTAMRKITVGSLLALLGPSLKSGTSQVNAGAASGELWVDTSSGNTVKRGA